MSDFYLGAVHSPPRGVGPLFEVSKAGPSNALIIDTTAHTWEEFQRLVPLVGRPVEIVCELNKPPRIEALP